MDVPEWIIARVGMLVLENDLLRQRITELEVTNGEKTPDNATTESERPIPTPEAPLASNGERAH